MELTHATERVCVEERGRRGSGVCEQLVSKEEGVKVSAGKWEELCAIGLRGCE